MKHLAVTSLLVLVLLLTAPVLALVAEHDSPSQLNGNQDMVEVVLTLVEWLRSGGTSAQFVVYPPCEQGHGHMMFFEVGAYWADVLEFLGRYV